MEQRSTCGSHEYIDQSIKRQELILEQFRQSNQTHQLEMTKILSEISAELKAVGEIRGKQDEHNRRWNDDKVTCEEHRGEMWDAINNLKLRQNKKDGTMVVVASVSTSIGAAIAWLISWLQKNP